MWDEKGNNIEEFSGTNRRDSRESLRAGPLMHCRAPGGKARAVCSAGIQVLVTSGKSNGTYPSSFALPMACAIVRKPPFSNHGISRHRASMT